MVHGIFFFIADKFLTVAKPEDIKSHLKVFLQKNNNCLVSKVPVPRAPVLSLLLEGAAQPGESHCIRAAERQSCSEREAT